MYFIGHKKPDTDSVCSAIAAAKLFKGTPAIADKLNKETEYVLNYFQVQTPAILADLSGQEIFLVDHNQTPEMQTGYEKAIIKGLIDHHALLSATLTTTSPIEVTIKPWGSAATIIADLYFAKKEKMDKPTAGILLAAILSDTLAFKSPTTTIKDKEIGEKLRKKLKLKNYLSLAKEMFKAKSDLSALNVEQILNLDYKVFEMGSKKVGIGVAETVEPEMILNKKDEYIKAMVAQKEKNKLDYVYFWVIDILNSHSQAIITDDNHAKVAQEVFGGQVKNNLLDTKNILSRKKEIVPPMTKYFTK